VNRSATITLAVLVELEGMSLDAAFHHMLCRRSVHPFPGNKQKIAHWEQKRRGVCSKPAWLERNALAERGRLRLEMA
jgi:protein-tyrosine phosphatase